MRIVRATTEEHWQHARELVTRYAASLSVDLAYQNFADELDSLPHMYGSTGGLWLAHAHIDSGFPAPVGCVALRRLAERTAELKRLFVLPEGRGLGLGRRLTEAALQGARKAGHTRVRLDTLGDMHAARGLYARLGFVEIPPYYDSPVAGTTFMEIAL